MLRKVTDLPCRVENGNLVELHDHLSRIVILIDGDQFIGLTIRIKLGCKEVREKILAKERAICGTTQRPIENPLFVADLHAERDRRVLLTDFHRLSHRETPPRQPALTTYRIQVEKKLAGWGGEIE